jgi:hypothetical protein
MRRHTLLLRTHRLKPSVAPDKLRSGFIDGFELGGYIRAETKQTLAQVNQGPARRVVHDFGVETATLRLMSAYRAIFGLLTADIAIRSASAANGPPHRRS